MMEYRLKFPIRNVNFDKNELLFSINHMRSKRPSVFYFILHLYNSTLDTNNNPHEIYYNGTEVVESSNTKQVAYTSPRSVIGTAYGSEGGDYIHSFTINEDLIEPTTYYNLELVMYGLSSANPLYFAEPMFQEGDEDSYDGYHTPSELVDNHLVELPNNMYANLYLSNGDYLQVIRPRRESFNTNELLPAQYTILAPHFEDEDDVDSHVSVFYEAINQTEQTIDVLR